MYNFFSDNTDLYKFIIEKMTEYIHKEVEKVVNSADLKTKPLEMVTKLIKLYNSVDEIVSVSFGANMTF